MEKFCLKWNDFQANVSKSFSSLRKEEDFFDVTLMSDDDKTVSAHKVVLAASSEFFRRILKRADHSKPMIYLSGINHAELIHIMEYIYEGELNIYQTELDGFLDVAQKLKIQGLIGSHEKEGKGYLEQDQAAEEYEITKEYSNTYFEEKTVENEYGLKSFNTRAVCLPTSSKSSIYEEAKRAVDDIVIKVDDFWMCKTCNKTAKTTSQIRKHAEIHIEGLSFPCHSCGDSFRSRIQLGDHKRSQHRHI